MRIGFRFDANKSSGAGHAIRSLVLAQEFARGGAHEIFIWKNSDIGWVNEYISSQNWIVYEVESSSLPKQQILDTALDLLIVDSYDIPHTSTSELNTEVRCIRIMDWGPKIFSHWGYLILTPSCDKSDVSEEAKSLVFKGIRYFPIRKEFSKLKVAPTSSAGKVVLLQMGGGQQEDKIAFALDAIKITGIQCTIKVVSSSVKIPKLAKYASNALQKIEFMPPTHNIFELYSNVNFVISAAGTTMWELLSTDFPSLFISIAENQKRNLEFCRESNLGLTFDLGEIIKDQEKILLANQIENLFSVTPIARNAANKAGCAIDSRGAYRFVQEITVKIRDEMEVGE